MSISSSLNAGVAGLRSNATRLATISDNIANSGTYGYKRATADFESMVIGSTAGTYSAGGVRVTTQRLIDERGSLISTSNPTDLAVRGRGMLPVTNSASLDVDNGNLPLMMTTTGSFRRDDEGFLTTPGGLVLMGWPADSDGTIPTFSRDTQAGLEPVQVNLDQFLGEPTTTISLGMNLPATSTDAGADGTSEALAVEYYDNLGKSESIGITFTPTVPTTGSSNTWTMVLTDSASDDAVIGEYTLVFDDDRDDGGELLSVTAVTGGAYDPATGEVALTVAGGPMNIDLGLIGAQDGMTQLGNVFAGSSVSKDGSPVGSMTSVEVDENGYVHALFNVGISQIIYQIPIVDVANPNGLQSMDQQSFSITSDSGAFFLWDAGDGPTGDIVGYAREESATDVANELTQLIQTQRAYSSNAKVIQTVDEMLQETTNIKR